MGGDPLDGNSTGAVTLRDDPRTAEVIGGGCVGAFIGYRLTRLGVSGVVLLEKSALASGSRRSCAQLIPRREHASSMVMSCSNRPPTGLPQFQREHRPERRFSNRGLRTRKKRTRRSPGSRPPPVAIRHSGRRPDQFPRQSGFGPTLVGQILTRDHPFPVVVLLISAFLTGSGVVILTVREQRALKKEVQTASGHI